MDARLLRRLVAGVAAAAFLLGGAIAAGAQFATPNFVIRTESPQLAAKFGAVAEQLRRDLAVEWTGQSMPNWAKPCPVTVQVGEHLGAGGATSFLFERGEVYGWTMNIQGSAQRVLDSVLPHEILHMVFATHFRQPLPRWADEGAATTVEHPSEQIKHKRKLIEFLQTGRGIAFNQLFAMMDYPPNDPMPLYAHGYSLVDFLIQQGGRRRYVEFLETGLRDHRWSDAVERYYGKRGLGDLQTQWVAWVAQGSRPLATPPATPKATVPAAPLNAPSDAASLLAASARSAAPTATWAAARLPRPEPNLVYRDQPTRPSPSDDRPLGPLRRASPAGAPDASQIARGTSLDPYHESGLARPVRAAATAGLAAPSADSISTVLGRPQPVEPHDTIVLEPAGRP